MFTWSSQFGIGYKSGCMLPPSHAAVHSSILNQSYMDVMYKLHFSLFLPFQLSPSLPLKPLYPCMSYNGSATVVVFLAGGMRYHLLSPEDREELVEGTRPRRKKHDYRIALFGGSQPQSCRYFNPKVIVTSECIKIHCL